MTHVVVSNITPRTSYSPTTGTSYVIPSTWGFFATSDIVAYSGTTQLSYAATPTSSTNFATSGTAVDGGYQGGNIVLGAASTANTITLLLDVPVARETDFPYPSATINIEDLNTDLDKAYVLMQQFVRDLARAPLMVDSDTGSIGTLPHSSARAGYLLAFDTTGGVTLGASNAATLPVTIANGGTSATTASGARTNLGLAIGTDVQAYDADLTTLGAGGAGARSFLGLAIGTDVQAFDSIHTALAALTSSGFIVRGGSTTLTTRTLTGTTNEIDIAAGSGSTGAPIFSLPAALTFTGKTVTGGTFNTAALTSGTITGGTASSLVITGGSLTSGTIVAGTWTSGTISTLISPLQVAYGGTSATTAAGARTNLGLAIGTDVQIYNADLTDLAASRVIGRGSASSGVAEDLTLTARLTMSGTTLDITAPVTVAYGGTSATTSSGAVANLNVPYDFAFNAGFSSTGGTANLVAQTYGELISGRAVTALSEQGYIGTAGSTQAVIVDIEVNGTTIYSTKPQFGTTNALTAGTLSNSTIAAGDRVTFKVTQIGSTGTPGAGLRFTLLTKMRV